MHANARLMFQKHAAPLLRPGMKVLEIGPDGFPSSFQRLSDHLPMEWHTLDILDEPRLTYSRSAEYSFPVPDNTYDVVVSGNVIEHVRKPWRWMPEMARVIRSGGLVITINPVSWIYHEAPVDCWRAYPEGMKALYEDAALRVMLSVWESLETPGYRKRIPGVSRESQGFKKRLVSSLFGPLGFPVECAYDTITIGQKLPA